MYLEPSHSDGYSIVEKKKKKERNILEEEMAGGGKVKICSVLATKACTAPLILGSSLAGCALPAGTKVRYPGCVRLGGFGEENYIVIYKY
jgi:hypothetical protein